MGSTVAYWGWEKYTGSWGGWGGAEEEEEEEGDMACHDRGSQACSAWASIMNRAASSSNTGLLRRNDSCTNRDDIHENSACVYVTPTRNPPATHPFFSLCSCPTEGLLAASSRASLQCFSALPP